MHSLFYHYISLSQRNISIVKIFIYAYWSNNFKFANIESPLFERINNPRIKNRTIDVSFHVKIEHGTVFKDIAGKIDIARPVVLIR